MFFEQNFLSTNQSQFAAKWRHLWWRQSVDFPPQQKESEGQVDHSVYDVWRQICYHRRKKPTHRGRWEQCSNVCKLKWWRYTTVLMFVKLFRVFYSVISKQGYATNILPLLPENKCKVERHNNVEKWYGTQSLKYGFVRLKLGKTEELSTYDEEETRLHQVLLPPSKALADFRVLKK